MISHKEIHEKATNPNLSQEELQSLHEMEILADKIIEEKYVHSVNGNVCIDANAVNDMYKKHPNMRKSIILAEWKKMLNSAGWEVSYDHETVDYILKGKTDW